ncbi:MAG: hypothetical protein V3T86_15645 [Planctomycetota bacterium]
MGSVSLAGGAELSPALSAALDNAADSPVLEGDGCEVRVRLLRPAAAEPAGLEVEDAWAEAEFVLAGGALLLVVDGGVPAESEWRVLNALHLSVPRAPLPDAEARPTTHPAMGGIEPIRLTAPIPVSGVGHSLLRVGSETVALCGERGRGRLILLGSSLPLLDSDPSVGLALFRWLCQKP